MKKVFCLLISLLYAGIAFSEEVQTVEKYRINSAEYEIKGSTREYSLRTKESLDCKRIFNNADELVNYIEDYKERLENLRAFDTVDVDYKVSEPDENNLCLVALFVKTKDSLHFLGTPYPKYDSNSGFTMKIKLKDTNFLGTLEEMNSDVNFAVENDSEKDEVDYKLGFNINFDIPFKMNIFDAKFTNSHEFSYTFGESTPEWNLKSGIELEKKFDTFAIDFNIYQSFIRDLDYEDETINGKEVHYGDGTYFTEKVELLFPITIQEIENWGKVYYTPYTKFEYNWDFDGIDSKNKDLQSPVISVGQKLSTSRVNWEGNFRTGISASLNQSISYNIQKEQMIPGIEGEFKGYKALGWLGFCTDIYAFGYLNGTSKFGNRLRGIPDNQYYDDDTGHGDEKACESSAAFVMNIDIPVRLFKIYWEDVPFFNKFRFMKIFNMEAQLSPFFDFALFHNRATETAFDYKDGFYAGGLEGIVYPLKWKGIQIRGSLGIDLGKKTPKIKNKLNQDWRDSKWYEISIGIGLHY